MTDKRMSSEHRKLCILSAVRGLFCKKGLNVTSKELSEAAGVSEALIYRHFDSKEGLYAALLQKCCSGPQQVGQELADLEPSTEVLVLATSLMVHVIVSGMHDPEDEFHLTSEERYGLMLQSFQMDGEVARSLFNQGLGPWVSYFVAGLEAAKKSGDLHPSSIDFETLIWMAHHSTIGMRITRHPKPDAFMGKDLSEEEFKEHALIFVLRGMGLKEEAIKKFTSTQTFKDFKNKINSL